jgi:hypothetical protein
MGEIKFKQITKKDLETYKSLILPMVYEELLTQEDIETQYIALGAWSGKKAVGAIVTDLEDSGDLTMLSIWTGQESRRQGIASMLLKKMLYVAYRLYNWQQYQYGDDIQLKTMYCLADEYREPFEEWLKKNDFTEFYIMRDSQLGQPDICSAMAEIHIYRFGEEELS